jgi:hypothetical protein
MQSQVKIGQSRTGFRLVTERARTGEHFWKELDELRHERWSNRWGKRYKTYIWSPIILARIQTYALMERLFYRPKHYQRAATCAPKREIERPSRVSLSKFPSVYHLGRVANSAARSALRSGPVARRPVRRYRFPVAYEKCVIRDMPRD